MAHIAVGVGFDLGTESDGGVVDDFHRVAIARQHLDRPLVPLAAVVVEEDFLHAEFQVVVAPLTEIGILAAHDDAHSHILRCYLRIIGLHLDGVLLIRSPILAVLVDPRHLLWQVVNLPRSSVVVVHQRTDVNAQTVDAVLMALDVFEE